MFKYLSIAVIAIPLVLTAPASRSLPEVGQKAPEIALPSPVGKDIKLSSLKGNLVLVNFWSTWCVACVMVKNPEYKRLYEKYKDYSYGDAKSFQIYSVAFDSDKDKWVKRIAEDELNWPNHVADKASYNSALWFDYDLQYIPASFLLDENGKIVGKNWSYSQIDSYLAKRKTGTTTPPPTPTPTPSPTPTPTPTPTPKPTPTPTPTPPPTPKPTPTPIPTPTPTPTPKSTDGKVFKIQLSVTTNPDLRRFAAVEQLGNLELEAVGSSARLKRVLLGTFTQAQVSDVLAAVQKKGFPDAFSREFAGSTAATPAPTPTPTPPPANTPPKNDDIATKILQTIYKIQLGVFSKANLDKFKPLSSIGKIEVQKTSKGLDKVLLAEYDSQAKADNALTAVKAKGFADAFLVSEERASVVLAAAGSQLGDEYKPDYKMPEPELLRLTFPELKASMLKKDAPKMVLDNTQGAAIPLGSTQGKLTLLYFWATWDGVAHENHADLATIYSKYKRKNFEIYSVAVENRPDRWKEALAKDKVNWGIQVIEPQGVTSPLLNKYNVEMLPALFLIDESGRIVGENFTYEQLDEELKRRLSK